jgi:hypothetical protein
MDGAVAPLTPVMTVDVSSTAPVPLAFPAAPAAAVPDGIPASGVTTSVMARTADAGPPSHRVVGVAASSARSAQAWVTAALKSSALVVPQALVANRPPVTPD